MTIDHCPGCQHLRCPNCSLEIVKLKASRGGSSRGPFYHSSHARSEPIEYSPGTDTSQRLSGYAELLTEHSSIYLSDTFALV